MANILIIEDNPANLKLMSYLLTRFGHNVESAGNAMEAVSNLDNAIPDLVLCDIQLPELDGYGVLRIIRNKSSMQQVPVVAVSAFAMPADKEKALAGGFDGYITKPIDPATFVPEVETFFRPKS